MAIFVPAPPARRGPQAKGDWQRYVDDLRVMQSSGGLTDSEYNAVKFQIRLAENLLEQIDQWELSASPPRRQPAW
ncbi:hypothetical protein [Burkholderia lata]|uniref:hypothetical protein n=1 Tax=Burkholderia lata (strain ATCC 17760 / DSM 23089 / LMG 22485 / NCIMB 9086 / R18194 / 383) TaxID=482957 RepID=UPI00399AFE60